MAIKLIAMDLDGTLLNSDKHISPRSLRTLQKAMEQGVYVTLATGRMPGGAAAFARQYGANAPLICCNGGVVQGLDDEEPLFMRCLPDETARRLIAFCYERGWYISWFIGNEIYGPYYSPELYAAYRTVEGFSINEIGDDYLPYTHDVIQCVIRDLHGGIPMMTATIKREFAGEIVPQQNTGLSSDLNPTGVTKALGLEFLMKHYGLTPEEVMACGNADNDYEMLRFAGTAVAPCNANDEAKKLATYVSPSNDEDGIAQAIEELVLQQ